MKVILLILSLVIFNQTTNSPSVSDPENELYSITDLEGDWTIDLRPFKNAVPYYQTFEVKSVKDKSFSGSFYGSRVTEAKLNRNWDRLYFAFTTYDSSNAYYHSGYLKDGKVYGITYCPNRNMVSPWTGIKSK